MNVLQQLKTVEVNAIAGSRGRTIKEGYHICFEQLRVRRSECVRTEERYFEGD